MCTGQDDWVSRIEEENSGDNLAADLKELFGRGGEYSDVSFLLDNFFFHSFFFILLLFFALGAVEPWNACTSVHAS